MGLFGANMADFQMGLALDAAANKAGGASRRLNQRVAARLAAANRGLHAIDATPARVAWPTSTEPARPRFSREDSRVDSRAGYLETDEEIAQDDDRPRGHRRLVALRTRREGRAPRRLDHGRGRYKRLHGHEVQ